MQLRLTEAMREKIRKIATVNGIDESTVIRLCLGQTLPKIEAGGITILPAEAPRAAAKRAA